MTEKKSFFISIYAFKVKKVKKRQKKSLFLIRMTEKKSFFIRMQRPKALKSSKMTFFLSFLPIRNLV